MTIFQDKTTKIVIATSAILALLFLVGYLSTTYRPFRVALLASPLVWIWLRAVPVIWRDQVSLRRRWAKEEAEFQRDHPLLSALGVGLEKPMDPVAIIVLWLSIGAGVVALIALWTP